MVSTEYMSHLNLANLKTLSVEPSIRLVELSLIHQVWFGTTYLSFNLLYRWVGYRWFMNHTWMDPHSAGRKLNLFILLRRKLFPRDGRDLETSGSSWQDGLGPWSRIDIKSHPIIICSFVQIWVPPPASPSIYLLISLPHGLRDVIGGTQASLG